MSATIKIKGETGEWFYMGTTKDSIEDIAAKMLTTKAQQIIDDINAGKHAALYGCIAFIPSSAGGLCVQCKQGYTVHIDSNLIADLQVHEIINNLSDQLDQWINYDKLRSTDVISLIHQ